ncbi:MAG: chorismate synthase [Acidiferrobacterales bacterium]|nr:chorismate synthase [Acidiferrobacterales bacterium]
MSGNSFGTLFTLTTFGESHGPAIGCIVDGCPPGMELSESDIQLELDRRKPGTSKFTSQRREPDQVQILSGVFENRTTGTPIGLIIHNTEQRSRDYSKIMDRYRPGHADYTYARKYGIRDHRGGGRSSARETALRVAAGAIARKYLQERYGTTIRGCVSAIGTIQPESHDWSDVETNPFFWPCQTQVPQLEKYVDQLRRQGNSVGACILVEADGVPTGWGEPLYARLDAEIASAMMGINAVKGVEIGAGFSSVSMTGSEYRDEMTTAGFRSNNAGGIAGGISTGQPIVVSVAFKPTSSILIPGTTVNRAGENVEVSVSGRHDPCVGLRAAPIAEAMMALVLMDMALRHRAQNADVVPDAPDIPGVASESESDDVTSGNSATFEASGED